MTIPERVNAATFLMHTTVRPFTFTGSCFKCFYCHKYHTEASTLMEHTTTHNVDDLDIILDKYIPKGKRSLQVDISNLKCKICSDFFINLSEIRSHLENSHKIHFRFAGNGILEYNMTFQNDVFSCHICRTEFPTFRLLNSHMNSHSSKVVCENCGAGFMSQYLLLKHKEIHLTKKFNCKCCEKVFSKGSQLRYHTETVHKVENRVCLQKCPHCSETFKQHYAKMLHLKEVHGLSKTFVCHICKSSFKTRRTLTEHVTKYHTEKFKCNVCSKCFSIESKLRQHMRGHTGERNYVCSVCKNAFMQPTTLKKHMRTHSRVFKFVCSECGSGFHTKAEMGKHMKWHQGFKEVE